jgi:hypothetical protein
VNQWYNCSWRRDVWRGAREGEEEQEEEEEEANMEEEWEEEEEEADEADEEEGGQAEEEAKGDEGQGRTVFQGAKAPMASQIILQGTLQCSY